MAHYAQIDNNNIVIQVIKTNDDQQEIEKWLVDTYGGTWIQTSYNTRNGVYVGNGPGTALRVNFAGIGMKYDKKADAFYSDTCPIPSWKLNKKTKIWEAPVKKPIDTPSIWNETTKSWDITPKPFPLWEYDKKTDSWRPPLPKPWGAKAPMQWDESTQFWSIIPKPYLSWVYNKEADSWEAPVPVPPLGNWTWDEDDKMWYPSDPITRKLYA